MEEARKLIIQIWNKVFEQGNEEGVADLIIKLLEVTNYDLEAMFEIAGKTLGMEKYVWFYMYIVNAIIHSHFTFAN